MDLHELKKSLRSSMKARRSEISASEHHEKSQKIIKNLQNISVFDRAKSVFCYISYLSEVDTHPIIHNFIRKKTFLAVPKIIGKTEMIAIKLTNWEGLSPDNMGILTPQSDQAESIPFDIAITPGLAFTTTGDRLGYGRGYYDRWFSKHDVKTKIAIAFEMQILEQLPTESTDIHIDMIVTEDRIIETKKN